MLVRIQPARYAVFMQSSTKKSVLLGASRYTTQIWTRCLMAGWVLRQVAKHLTANRTSHRDYASTPFSKSQPDIFDVPTAVAIRIASQFKTVIEIGAAGGGRIHAIKTAVPSITAIGMDIGPDYRDCHIVDGVTHCSYQPDAFTNGALVVSVGTATCMTSDELSSLFQQIARKQCTLLLFEPAPPFHISQSFARGRAAWYHPYDSIADQHGLCERCSDERTWRHTGNLKQFERWPGMIFGCR